MPTFHEGSVAAQEAPKYRNDSLRSETSLLRDEIQSVQSTLNELAVDLSPLLFHLSKPAPGEELDRITSPSAIEDVTQLRWQASSIAAQLRDIRERLALS